jgi:CRISPR-associated Csx2 family protein
MTRKLFISILGAGPYGECTYSANEKPVLTTRYIQLATLKHLVEKGAVENNSWTSNDAVIIFLTSKAESDQWLKGKAKEGKEIIVKEGLKAESEKMNFPFVLTPKPIQDGKDTDEIWDIFDTIFNEINDGDELYFDITHAFRYLPMLLTVLINYSKFLKKVTVKSITYGNFMAETELKPIMDLTSISVLQDWTFAAGQYLESGNVERLVKLCNEEINPVLRETKGSDEAAKNLKGFVSKLSDVIDERLTCRGMSIIKSPSFKGLKGFAEKIANTTFIQPFNPVFEKIKSSFGAFDENENVKNGFMSALWCFNNGLYQQAATILQEIIVTFVCSRHDIKIDDEFQREIVNKAFNIAFNKTEENDWKIDESKKAKLKDVLTDDIFTANEYVNGFINLTEVRNDFNHSGMRSVQRPPMKPADIKKNINKCINVFSKLF